MLVCLVETFQVLSTDYQFRVPSRIQFHKRSLGIKCSRWPAFVEGVYVNPSVYLNAEEVCKRGEISVNIAGQIFAVLEVFAPVLRLRMNCDLANGFTISNAALFI